MPTGGGTGGASGGAGAGGLEATAFGQTIAASRAIDPEPSNVTENGTTSWINGGPAADAEAEGIFATAEPGLTADGEPVWVVAGESGEILDEADVHTGSVAEAKAAAAAALARSLREEG